MSSILALIFSSLYELRLKPVVDACVHRLGSFMTDFQGAHLVSTHLPGQLSAEELAALKSLRVSLDSAGIDPLVANRPFARATQGPVQSTHATELVNGYRGYLHVLSHDELGAFELTLCSGVRHAATVSLPNLFLLKVSHNKLSHKREIIP